MQEAKDLNEYREHIKTALQNDFQRQALDKFAKAYPVSRANAFKGLDTQAMIDEVARIKDAGLAKLDALYEEFKRKAEANGVHVHLAKTAHEANEIIARIAQENGVKKIVKSKSMTAEETHLNKHLEKFDLEVTETDLGEWIIQLRNEGPTHMVMPAIHLSRHQVADLFSAVTGAAQEVDIDKLVKVARRELRAKYVEADMGISGGNFAVAETGSLGIITNEGNARLVTTLPRVHVALLGLDKLTATLDDALKIIRVLPKNATGQNITSYVTWITGANECASAPDGKKIMHVVFLDNGRRSMAAHESYKEVLRCVRCGACANVCPVYRLVGGHEYGDVYIGAIGLILTYFFHSKEKAKALVQNCVNCQACKEVCASGIDLPRIIKEVYNDILNEEGRPVESKVLGLVLKNRALFHGLLRTARLAQKPIKAEQGYLRHLPLIFSKEHNFRALPAIADKPFRDRWNELKHKVSPANPRYKVALFSGCVQDFVYPEQLEAVVELLEGKGVQLDFPMGQTCCGLPVRMMGEFNAAKDVAEINVNSFDPSKYDYIMTLCASCGGYLKEMYPRVLTEGGKTPVKAQQFADKVISLSEFMARVLKLDPAEFQGQGKVTFHSPCHLARGMNVREEPHEAIRASGHEYVPLEEEHVCCGFGGTYSMKFPQVSKELLDKKIANIEASGADILVTECPGCTMQIRGGLHTKGSKVRVMHTSELLAKARKKK